MEDPTNKLRCKDALPCSSITLLPFSSHPLYPSLSALISSLRLLFRPCMYCVGHFGLMLLYIFSKKVVLIKMIYTNSSKGEKQLGASIQHHFSWDAMPRGQSKEPTIPCPLSAFGFLFFLSLDPFFFPNKITGFLRLLI